MEIRHTLKKSAKFGNLEFPTREDYVEHFISNGTFISEKEIFESEQYISGMHRHWHSQGGNGCVFAMLGARRAEDLGWQDYVITQHIDDIERNATYEQIAERIQKAIRDPHCEILSLLFSNVISDNDLVRLIIQLCKIKGMLLVDETDYDQFVTVALRYPINKEQVLSWLMAFGPFNYFPHTRQAPITEIAIRVKPKHLEQFHRLSKDKDAAHLADLPIDFRIDVMEKTWEKTFERTEQILGEKPNQFSAAKTTLTIPKEVWNAHKERLVG